MEFDFMQQPGLVKKKAICDEIVKPLVSIITPYYNGSRYFEQTFNCVINQTFPWFEWIIVDDGSKEEEYMYLKNIVQNDTRIKIYTKKNGGPASARNFAIKCASTDIVVSLDADDLICPTYIETTYWALYYNPNAGWAYTDSLGFGTINYTWKVPFDSDKLKNENFLIEVGTIRKKALIDVGGYDDREKHSHEDWRLWLQLLSKGYYPVHLGYYGAWYRRINDGSFSITANDQTNSERAYAKIKEVADTIQGRIEAIEYPLRKTDRPYHQPEMIKFDLFHNHESKKIKILLIIPWMVMGGADKFNLDLISGLNKEKFEVSIITTVPSENDWQQRFEKYTDEIFNLPEFLDPAYYIEFVSYYIKSRDIDVLMVSNSQKGYYMLPWLRKQFPKLCIIDYVHMEEWYWKAGGHARTSGMLGAFLDKTYVCNSATREVMIRNFGRSDDSVKTLYIGVDQNEFDKTKVEKGYLYNKLGISSDRPIILFPCRIHPQKRPFMIIDIAKCVREQNQKALFVVAGDGEQLEELKAEIVKQGIDDTIICIGRTDKMKECYADASITLVCSIKEGLSLTAYESCSMGVPVISSDVGGQRDLVDSSVGKLISMRQKEDGDFDKREFDQGEVREYAEAILELLSDKKLYDSCSQNCRRKIEKDFSIATMIDNMENEIETLVSDKCLINKHIESSAQISEMENFSDEFYAIHNALEEREAECEVIWRDRCFFERNWTNEMNEKNNAISENERLVQEKAALTSEKEKIEQELTDFKSMRLYGLIRFYCYFVGENKIGKCIYGVLRKFFGKKK